MEAGESRGFVVLYRSLLDWEWYTDANTSRLFIHLLLTVNHTSKQWQGLSVERGQRVASYAKLALETGMTIKEIRTALNHLKKTGEVAHKAYPKFGLFTIKNYDKYQTVGSQSAVKGQSEGSQGAVKGQQLNNDNNENNVTMKTNIERGGVITPPLPDKPARTRFVPPTEEETVLFFRENGSSKEEAESFRDYYQANGWKIGGKSSMKDWRAAARNWIRRAGSYKPSAKAEQPSTTWDILDKAAERIEKGDFSFMEV